MTDFVGYGKAASAPWLISIETDCSVFRINFFTNHQQAGNLISNIYFFNIKIMSCLEILNNTLERNRRGVYTGSINYLLSKYLDQFFARPQIWNIIFHLHSSCSFA